MALLIANVPLIRGRNVEQVFSRAELLSDPNIDPEFLARIVMLAVNKKWFKPSVQAIKDKYYEIFRGKRGALSEDQLVEQIMRETADPIPISAGEWQGA